MDYIDKYRLMQADYTKRYNELETEVMAALVDLVKKHGVKSDTKISIQLSKQIKYNELALYTDRGDRLSFIDKINDHYMVSANADLDELIYLLTDLKNKFN